MTAPQRRRSRRLLTVVLPAGLLAAGLLAMSAAAATGAEAGAAGSAATATDTARSASSTPDSFRQTKTITRTNLIDGQNVQVDKRTVTLTVANTANLINREPIQVNWSGAHPTGGIDTDGANPNADIVDGNIVEGGPASGYQEYPMVLLECHGTAATISPEDCWTTEWGERVFEAQAGGEFPPWRLDRYGTASGQRNFDVGIPSALPAACQGQSYLLTDLPSLWLPYVTPTGTSYPVGFTYTLADGTQAPCAGAPGEMDAEGGIGILPSNETYAATAPDGKGAAQFDIWTSEANSDLGCQAAIAGSAAVPCALVAVPIMGISCDPAMTGMPADDQIPADEQQQAAAECEQTGSFSPGELANASDLINADYSVTGQLWWAASNWRNRFVVPLTFAPPGNICEIVNKGNHVVSAFGSELLDQAQLQWQPHFCLSNKLFTMDYAQAAEPEAAGDLETTESSPGSPPAGSVEAALVSNQPAAGFAKPVVHAPVAATAFAISFVIDNAARQQVTTLRLDPRLLAKLLTESYPGNTVGDYGGADPELEHACPAAGGIPVPASTMCTNPEDITQDPEFQALNPGISFGAGGTLATYAASALLALSTQSDVMWALTSYINDNPAARAWLNGAPDPWGMTVNSAYKGIALPVSIWPLQSTWEPPGWTSSNSAQNNECYFQDPSPILPLIAAPVADLPDIAEDIQFANVQSTLVCNFNPQNPGATLQLSALGEQTPGDRFMIAVTSLADAQRYGLTTASLLTYTKPGTPAEFTSADVSKDMTFIGPSDASMRTAAALLVANKAGHDWTFPYALYKQDSTRAEQAYPGTMLVYADVPTSQLPKADAKDYAGFVQYVATKGQQPGGGVGQLAAGYLPMTNANHLGAEAAYAVSAASAIGAQKGAIPPLFPAKKSHSTSPSSAASPASAVSPAAAATSSPAAGSPSSSGPSTITTTPQANASSAAALRTPFQNFGIAGYLLPVIAGLALAGAAGAYVVARLNRPGSRKLNWRSVFTRHGQ